MSKPAIICIDDEPTVLESLKIELKQVLGDTCLIETAESGEEALELLGELQTDQYEVALVFADQIMPGMRGDQLLKQIHTVSPRTLNIMISGHADLETLSQTLRSAGLYRYIAKPWQFDDLRSTTLEALQSYHRTRELEAENLTLRQTIRQLENKIGQFQNSERQLLRQSSEQEMTSRLFLSLMTEIFQQHEAMQTQIADLQQLNQLKDNFLDAISHELRAPISNIRMATQMLEVRLQQLDIPELVTHCDRYVQILKTECQKEADLITDLLTLIRLDSNSEPLSLSTVDLKLWIPHIAEPFSERMQQRQQQLQVNLPELLPTLKTDLAHLERILTELLNNAWKYTPASGLITIAIEVPQVHSEAVPKGWGVERDSWFDGSATASVAVSAPYSEVWISISNTGVEIPVEDQEQIFEQFYRMATHNVWNQGGTGLGLAIVKKRVEKLRGTIAVSSHDDQTTFTVKLPLNQAINRPE